MSDYTLSVKVELDDKLSGQLKGVKDKVSEFGEETGKADGKTSTFGDTLKAVLASNFISGAVSKITGAVKQFGSDMLQAGMNFEAQMDKVGAISGASAADMEALTDKAKEMGSTTKFTATESGQALEYMAMAGWKTEDMLNGIEGVMNLAAASGEDLATTSDIVTDAMTAFGMSADESGRFADILAAASSNANTNVAMMGESFKYCAPVAGTLGYAAEDVAVAIGLMGNAGIKASNAGTALRTLLTNMTDPTAKMSQAMDMLGVSLDDGHGNMKSFKEVMDDLREGFGQLQMPVDEFEAQMNKLDEDFEAGVYTQETYEKMQEQLIHRAYGAEGALKAEAAAMLAGKTGMSGLAAIINASDEDYQKLTESIYNSSYSLEDISSNLQQCGVDWTNYSDKAWAAQDGMSGLVDDIVYNLQTLHTPLEEIQEYLVMEYEMDPTDALAAIESVQTTMEESTGTAEQMAEQMQDNLAGAMTRFGSAMEGLELAFFERLQAPLTNMVEFAKEGVASLEKGLREEGLPGMFEAAGDIWTRFKEGVESHMPEVISTGFDIAVQLVGGILDGLPEMALGAVEMADSFVTGLINKLDDVTESGEFISNGLVEKIMSFTPKLMDAGGHLIIHLAEGAVKLAPRLVAAAAAMIWDMLKEYNDKKDDMVIAGLTLIGELAIGMGKAAVDAGKHLVEWAYKWLDDLGVIDWIQAGIDIAKGIAQGIKDAAADIWNALLGAVGDAWNGALEWLRIGSPSKRARDEIGYNWAAGIGVGFVGGMDDAEATMQRSMTGTMSALTPDQVTTATSGARYETTNSNDYGNRIAGGVHITVNAARGQNEEDIADRVMNRIYSEFEQEFAYS